MLLSHKSGVTACGEFWIFLSAIIHKTVSLDKDNNEAKAVERQRRNLENCISCVVAHYHAGM